MVHGAGALTVGVDLGARPPQRRRPINGTAGYRLIVDRRGDFALSDGGDCAACSALKVAK